MARVLRFWAIALALCCLAAAPASARERRMALVIGISDYPAPNALINPVNDARSIRDALAVNGFEVEPVVENPKAGQLFEALDGWIAKIAAAAARKDEVTVFLYYSGHGIERSYRRRPPQAYLVPRDAKLLNPGLNSELETDGLIALIDVRQDLLDSGATNVIMVFDACRTVVLPAYKDIPSSGFSALPPVNGGAKTAIFYASSFGAPSYDSAGANRENVFAKNLARGLRESPYLNDAFDYARILTEKETHGAQTPTRTGDIDFILDKNRKVQAPAALGVVETDQVRGSPGSGSSAASLSQDGVREARAEVKRLGIAEMERLAARHDGRMEYLLGLAYAEGIGTRKDSARYTELIRNAVVDGELRAINTLGYAYFYGEMGKPDQAEGIRWWQLGQQRGVPGAINNLASLYEKGEGGFPRDPARAATLYSEAADKGSGLALTNLAGLYLGDALGKPRPDLAIETYLKVVRGGNPEGYANIAGIYQFGQGGEKIDERRANEYLAKAAEAGDGNGAYRLWQRYSTQTGPIPPQPEEAMRYLRRAADLEYPDAMVELGRRLQKGDGLPANPGEALDLFRRAAANGSIGGKVKLANALAKGIGGPADPDAANRMNLEIVRAEQSAPDPEVWPMDYYLAGVALASAMREGGIGQIEGMSYDEVARLYGDGKAMKQFTIPVDCNPAGVTGAKIPVQVYLFDWARENDMVGPQIAWLENQRGCRVDPAIGESFAKLYTIARDNKVSYQDLAVYALDAASDEAKKDGKDGKDGKGGQ